MNSVSVNTEKLETDGRPWTQGAQVYCDTNRIALSKAALDRLVHATVEPTSQLGWGQERRLRYGYFRPGEYYAGIVDKCLKDGATWLDVGGGRNVFPGFPALEKNLVSRASRLVSVDPSENVLRNTLASQCVQARIEEFRTEEKFDLVTARMVVEHVDDVEAFMNAIGRLLKQEGVFVVYTVNLWSLVTCVSRAVPNWLHNPAKRVFWGTEPKDTFPTCYKLNTRTALKAATGKVGLNEIFFALVDDCSVLSKFRGLGSLELGLWTALTNIGLPYPERNVISVFAKNG